jgi:hypothetical protein
VAPPDGAVVAGPLATITGTATDAGGGIVAGVEVSVDGGMTWHRATGTERWSYEWQVPEGSGTAIIQSRASDDSVNIETPREGVTLRYGRTAAAR